MAKDDKKPDAIIIDPDIQDDFLAASKLVCNKPCWVYSIIYISGNQATNVYKVYDGFSTADKEVNEGSMIAYQTIPFIPPLPMRFQKGIYIEFATNGHKFYIQFKPDY